MVLQMKTSSMPAKGDTRLNYELSSRQSTKTLE